MFKKQYKAAVITLSDKGVIGERIDTSGPSIIKELQEKGYEIVEYMILPDEKEQLKTNLIHLCEDQKCQLIITTGGTGCSPRDITPEATNEILEKQVPGIAEAIRYKSMQITPRAMLGRGVSGIRNHTLIVNLPGSEKAVKESLEVIIDTLDHAMDTINGASGDCGR